MAQNNTPNLNLLFIRHGRTQDNDNRILQGHRNTPLTPTGQHEAQTLANILASQPLDAIYHSPLLRITQTLDPILNSHPHVPVYVEPDLLGQGLGELEGAGYDAIDMSDPCSADDRPGVERFEVFASRLRRVFARIVGLELPKLREQGEGQGRERNVLVATHGVAITTLFKVLEGSAGAESGVGPACAVRGPKAWEVRWTDSDDVSRLVVPGDLPVREGSLDWEGIEGKGRPVVIEYWGKQEKRL